MITYTIGIVIHKKDRWCIIAKMHFGFLRILYVGQLLVPFDSFLIDAKKSKVCNLGFIIVCVKYPENKKE